MPARTRAASRAARGRGKGGERGRNTTRCVDTSGSRTRRSPRLVEAELAEKRGPVLKRVRNAKHAESECSESESSYSSSSGRSSSSRQGSPRATAHRRHPRGKGRGRDAKETSRGWDEEEVDDEALKREAQGFVGLREGLLFYKTYTATELIDSETKVKGRKTQVNVGDYVDLMVARNKTKDKSILYRFAQVLAIFQEAPPDVFPSGSSEARASLSSLGRPHHPPRKRQKGSSGSSSGYPLPGDTIKFEVRWVYDAKDLKQLGVSSAREAPLSDKEFAESDQCELVPAEWLDEEALVFRDREAYSKETDRRERLEKDGEDDEHLPPLCLITHFYCSKTNMLMPIDTVEEDSQQLLLNCSRFHRVYVDGQEGGEVCSGDSELTPVQRAIRRLQLDSVPDTLPCRTREYQKVRQMILTGIMQKQGGELLYISGLPGTGKTATVQSVLKGLQRDMQANAVPPFTCIELNAMRLQHPDLVFVTLYRHLFGCKPQSTQQAFAALDRKFTGESHAEAFGHWQDASRKRHVVKRTHDFDRPIVLVVDEVDCLVSAKQRVLYTLFDWPFHPSSRLVLIAIANTIDLPEKILNSRCASRIGFGRLTFNPYTSDQIEAIILDRLKGCRDLFADAAIKVCARKIANFYGDLRRALQVLRRALESLQGGKKIHPADINTAANDLFDSPLKDSITCLPHGVKLLLYCLLKVQRHSDAGVPLRALRDAYQTLLDVGKGKLTDDRPMPNGFKLPPVDFEDIKAMLDSLAGMRVVGVYLHLPRMETPPQTAIVDKKSRQTGYASGCSKTLSVDPVIDEAGGDTEVAIIAPMDELAAAFLKDAELEGLPL